MDTVTKEPVVFLFRKMWRFAKGHRGLVVLFIALSMLGNLVLLLQPAIFGEVINEVQRNGVGDSNINYILLILGLLFGSEILFWVLHAPSRLLEFATAFRTQRNYIEHLLKGVLGLGMSWHADRDSGETIDKINKASDGLYDFSTHLFIVFQVSIRIIGTTAILLFFNVYVGAVALAMLCVALTVIFFFDKVTIPLYDKMNVFDNKISARVFDALSNIITVKVLRIENPVFKGVQHTLWNPFALFKKLRKMVEVKWMVGSLLFQLIILVPFGLYIFYSYKHGLPVAVGTLSAMYLYLTNLFEVYYAFSSTYQDMIIARARIKNAEDLEEAFGEQAREKRKKVPEWQSIAVNGANFAYEDVEENAVRHIDDVSLVFGAGERIACIGESGSGKTTFLKVLHGMYTTAKAEIAFDGGDSRKTNFADIDLKTTLVPQEPEVFSASIRENITLGIEYSEADIKEAARLAEFDQVIFELPKGLESVINEKGVNLSGGQKQRLALSRALLFARDKKIILLDESTSSVDPENEVKIYANIFKAFAGKTIIASIHKMNLLKYFDRIVMFANGKIVAEGSFDELLTTNEKFKRDWEEYVAREGDR